jgi:hypothetical protein
MPDTFLLKSKNSTVGRVKRLGILKNATLNQNRNHNLTTNYFNFSFWVGIKKKDYGMVVA